ncbi:hypothetical protein DPEC_G00144530 [Dallia pectoralis]|uniref:Uncharacterized protein n=1 Tax=Dallia pectoralis TaxID=75939 RepID=A0ACC2GNU8_DALPE|nr:hypothetical protein DPEC_G00144530 [Dallia pectoralis]
MNASKCSFFTLLEVPILTAQHAKCQQWLAHHNRLVDANKKPGGACCACDASNEEFSITASSLAISDEPEPDLLEHQHQHDKKTENNSPAGVTDTCPSAPPTSTVPDSL